MCSTVSDAELDSPSLATQRRMDRGLSSPQRQLETSKATHGLPSAKVTSTACASHSKLFLPSLYFHDFSESHSYQAKSNADSNSTYRDQKRAYVSYADSLLASSFQVGTQTQAANFIHSREVSLVSPLYLEAGSPDSRHQLPPFSRDSRPALATPSNQHSRCPSGDHRSDTWFVTPPVSSLWLSILASYDHHHQHPLPEEEPQSLSPVS